MSSYCKDQYELCFTGAVADWLVKTARMPNNFATILAHIGLFVLMWYAVKFTVRLFLSIIWPIIIVCLTLLIIRIINSSGQDEYGPYIIDKTSHSLHWMVNQLGKIPQLFSKQCPVGSENCTW